MIIQYYFLILMYISEASNLMLPLFSWTTMDANFKSIRPIWNLCVSCHTSWMPPCVHDLNIYFVCYVAFVSDLCSCFLRSSGSATLHAWQQLAQPHLGGILDTRPGVVTKGFQTLELDLEEVYQFTDLEEDESGQHSQSAVSTSCLGSMPCSPALRRPRANNPDNQEEQLSENGGTPGMGKDRMEAGEEEVSSGEGPS